MSATPHLTAIVLAAGKGTRMKSERPKVLHEICGRPLVAFAIERALEVGADEIRVVVGHAADAVRARILALFPNAPIQFAEQTEQLGTGHAVMAARMGGLPAGDVLILSGDVPLITTATLKRLVAARREGNASASLLTTRPAAPRGYGRILRNSGGGFRGIVEEKDAIASEREIGEVNAGIYCVESAFLAAELHKLTPKNAQGEYYLTDVMAAGRKVTTIESPYAETAGINDREQLAEAETALRHAIAVRHMRAGVTMRDPGSTHIDEAVTIGEDSELGPGVSLHGATKIGRKVRIGQGVIVVDSTIADGVEIKPYCHIDGAHIGPVSIIGPFARLRPGTELADGVHIGNFVETKKARIGSGSKANHLTYLGDSVIGKGCNVGAGTITCNYDGVNKFETVLGDGVFIGSDTQLVAPVTLGDGAYIGAGSTITKDVPADALAFTRAPLVVKKDWASSRRRKLAEKKNPEG